MVQARILDFFRELSSSASSQGETHGAVRRRHFCVGMRELGLEVPLEAVDALFRSWDADGDGNLEYEELARALRSEPSELVRGAREAYVTGVRDGPERRPSKLKRAQTTV